MVWLTVNPSLRAASCCRVEVVKGGAGDFFTGRTATSVTVKVVSAQSLRKSRAASLPVRRRESSALTSSPEGVASVAFTR